MRTVPEWIGAHPDAAIPPRVRVRVFERYHGGCQHCMRKLYPGDKWECDHAIALSNGGEHRESNLWPICKGCHKIKTAQDVATKSKTYRMKAKHYGLKKPSRFPGSKDSPWRKKLNGEVVPR